MTTQDPTGAAGPVGPPVCPRHPDRVSYVRCQRCGRPVCPECQHPAAVGVHCVDCVAEARRTIPTQRTVFGAPVRHGAPVVTVTLITACVISFVLQLALGSGGDNPWTQALIFAPVLGDIEPYRFLTTAFLHSTGMILHIGFNMYALWIVGSVLEPALGRWRFLALYLLSALGGSVMVTWFASPNDLSWITGVVGASGAVFGLFGAFFVVLRRLGLSPGPVLAILVINGVIGFVVPGIAWEAHLGGLLVGAALTAVYAYAPKAERVLYSVAGTVVIGFLVVLAALGRYALV